MERRDFAKHIGAGAAGIVATVLAGSTASTLAQSSRPHPPEQDGHPHPIPSGPPLEIAMLAPPRLTAIDLVAPQLVFATLMNVNVHVVWKTREVLTSDSGLRIQPSATFDGCPADLDVLFVPGADLLDEMRDPEVLAFLRDRGSRAKWVTSVCTGAYLLGAAGLLRGYRATTWWPAREGLAHFGATPVAERVVRDRNRITGGGITAGLDFALHMSRVLRGDRFARVQQLVLEYDPKPPFGGSPQREKPEFVEDVRRMVESRVRDLTAAAASTRAG